MEAQWPLIIFTSLLAWSAGVFASQCVLALKGECAKAQMPAWIVAAVLLVVGGIAVFFHLEHWERIFNGFGHLSSGITQELIAVVVLAVVAVVYLVVMLRNGSKVPAALAIVGIVVSAAMVVVMGHSYMMSARPAWDSVFGVASLVGEACIMGPATVLALADVVGAREEAKPFGSMSLLCVAGSVVNAVCTVAYVAAASMATAGITVINLYYDYTTPNASLFDPSAVSPFSGGNLALTLAGVILAGVVVPLAAALVGKKQGGWKAWGTIAALGALVGTVCLRAVFFGAGASIFPIY